MADYRTWMLTGYRQSHTNGREGLQYMHTKGLSGHQYGNNIHNTDIKNWNTVDQSDHGAYTTSNGRYYCYSEGVIFSTATLMFTNPNTADVHIMLCKNGSRISLSNDHNGGGSGQGHNWNGMTTSALTRVAEGDYITVRCLTGSNSGFYLYGGGDYNGWQLFYIAGAQRDNPA